MEHMEKILEIQVNDDGLAMAGCTLETELDGHRLAAAFIVLAQENKYFAAALIAASRALLESPMEAKKLSDLSKLNATLRMFRHGTPEPGNKS